GMNEQSIRITNHDRTFSFVPGLQTIHHRTWLHTLDLIPKAGNYFLENAGGRLATISFNYDRRESEQKYLHNEDLQMRATEAGIKSLSFVADDGRPIGPATAALEQGTLLWKYFIFAVLLFLLAEALVLRFMP
ncbi:MAG TPA: hypothetical protein VLH16_00135, partial [Bacteroidales bacterium]|nr:hypothetical protein [Bacteroidales bacterium]